MSDKWVDELITATSIATFECTSRTNFVNGVERCIGKILSQNGSVIRTDISRKSSSTIHRYNPRTIESTLIQFVDWKSLILDHDQYVASSLTVKNASSSALQELINSLLDPRVIPFALWASLLRIFVWTFVSGTTTTQNWKRLQHNTSTGATTNLIIRSHSLLLQSIKRIMQRSQCRDDLGEIVLSVVQENPSLHAFQSALTLVKYLIKELKDLREGFFCPKRAMFPCLLGLLGEVMERKEFTTNGQEKDEGSICVSSCVRCIGTPAVKKRGRRPTQADLTALHEEWEGSEQPYYPSRKYQTNQRQSQNVSLKSILQEKDFRLSCKTCNDSVHLATVHAWCQFRDKCIHNIISIFQSTLLLSREKALNILRAVIRLNNENAYVRLFTLQLAEIGGCDFYAHCINDLWTLGWEWDQRYLTWYAEVIVESSFCDDRVRCWESLQPLVNSVLSRCEEEDSNKQERESPLKTLLPCLGYILSRRCNLLQFERDSIYQGFSSLTTELSLSFNDLKWWIAPSDNGRYSRNQHVVDVLQSLGIISASSILLEETPQVKVNNSHNPSEELLGWHAPEAEKMKSSFKRMTWSPHGSSKIHSLRYEMSSKLFSDPHADQCQFLSKPDVDQALNGRECTKQSAAIMLFLNNDNFRSIFEFLGYKKLVKLRRVCKNWKELADEDKLWRKHYEKRYGMLHDEYSRTNEASWKDNFISKWLAYRAIRFKYNQKGDYKYSICPYVGCYKVLNNPKVVESHKGVHEKRKIRSQEKEERERKRKIKRQEKEEKARKRTIKKAESSQKKTKIEQLPA